MDYLDPVKKKQKRSRIMIGYVLLGVAISIATVLLVNITGGYYFDRESGQVIQNGLIYVDSKPESAKISLNGQEQGGRTDARLVVPEGIYDLSLQRDGYRDWTRKLTLDGASVRRVNYARLVPTDLTAVDVRAQELEPSSVSQSIDKRWLVAAYPNNPLVLQATDLSNSFLIATEIALPVDILETRNEGTWEILEWADDNKTFLAVFTTTDLVEYALINRDKPNESLNLSRLFAGEVFDEISLRGRDKESLHLYDSATGVLKTASIDGTTEPLLTGVIDYETFESDNVVYVTKAGSNVKVVLKTSDESYDIKQLNTADEYFLTLSDYQSKFLVGVGSSSEEKVTVFYDPIGGIAQNDFSMLPVPTTVLRLENIEELTVSSNSSVILARSGTDFASHEIEEDRSYTFSIDKEELDQGHKIRWLDGRHLTLSSGGMQFMIDYDGSNQYDLVDSLPGFGSYFDADIDTLVTMIKKSAPATPEALSDAAAEPKTTYVLQRTYMRTPADR